MKVVCKPSKSNSCAGEKDGEHGGRMSTAVGSLCFAGSVQRFDVFTTICVGIVGGSTGQASLALARSLVELFADLENIILVVLVAVVIVLLGFLARDTAGLNERSSGVWKCLSVAKLLICAGGCGIGARLVHKGSDEDGLAVRTAVGSDEKLHFLVLLLTIVVLLAVVVLLLVIVHTLTIEIVLKSIFVDVELPAFNGLLEVELHTIVVVVVIIIFVFAVVKTCVCIASVGTRRYFK